MFSLMTVGLLMTLPALSLLILSLLVSAFEKSQPAVKPSIVNLKA